MTSKAKTAENCFIGLRTSSEEQKQRWMDYCDTRGISLTKLITDCVEANIGESGEDDYIGIHARSQGQKKRWMDHSEANGMSLDELIIESVEANVNPPEDKLDAMELRKKFRDLETQLRQRDVEVSRNERVIESLEAEVKALKEEKEIKDSTGVKQLKAEMVRLLRENRGESWTERRLLSELDIDTDDTQSTKAIANQIRDLEDLRLVRFVNRGWRWADE